MTESKLNSFFLPLIAMLISSSCVKSVESYPAGHAGLFAGSECMLDWKPYEDWVKAEFQSLSSSEAYWLFASGGDLSKENGYSVTFMKNGGHYFRSNNVRWTEKYEVKITEAAYSNIKSAFESSIKFGKSDDTSAVGFPEKCAVIIATKASEQFLIKSYSSKNYDSGTYGLKPVDEIYHQIFLNVPE